MSTTYSDGEASEDGNWVFNAQENRWDPNPHAHKEAAEGEEHAGGAAAKSTTGWSNQDKVSEGAFDFDHDGVRFERDGSAYRAIFTVVNTGEKGACTVSFFVDGYDIGVNWTSEEIEAGSSKYVGDGQLPNQDDGSHLVEVYAMPAGPGGGYFSTEISG